MLNFPTHRGVNGGMRGLGEEAALPTARAYTEEETEASTSRENLLFLPYIVLKAISGGEGGVIDTFTGRGFGALGPVVLINFAGWALVAWGAYSMLFKKGGN